MVNDIVKKSEQKMEKSVDSFKSEIMKVRTGRAHPNLLEDIKVEYYGQPTPLKQVASIVIDDPRTLSVTPWEKNMFPVVDKAITDANLGLNPTTLSDVIKVPLPPLNEERRKELVKQVKSISENAKVAVRNSRRDANQQLKDLTKKKEITEDDERKGQDKVQKLTDNFISSIDKVLSEKEEELMQL